MKYAQPLYNSRLIDTYIKLLKKNYRYVDIKELLSYAKMKDYEVEDPEHWFTQEQIDLFYEKILQLTKDENIARKAGRFAASPEALGYIRYWTLGFLSPNKAFELISLLASKLTKSAKYESEKIGYNKIKIKATPKKGVNEKKFQCENRKGYFEAIIKMLNYSQPKIEETKCIFNKDACCEYIISWKEPIYKKWKLIRNYASGIYFIFLIGYMFVDISIALKYILPGFVFTYMMLEIIYLLYQLKEKSSAIELLKSSSEELHYQNEKNYNNALLAHEIGEHIAKPTDKKQIVNNVVKLLHKRLDFDRGMVLLANENETQLKYKNGFGYTKDEKEIVRNESFNLNKEKSKGAFVLSYKKQEPYLVNDIDNIKSDLSLHSFNLAKQLNVRSFICSPIVYENKSYGVLAVDNVNNKRPLVARDANLLMGIAHFIGISFRNVDLLKSKEDQFNSLLKVLAASIDARDSTTSGHSERVTEYALGISNELKLNKNTRYVIQVAALLHDYGKLAVPDQILNKPASLTEEEYDLVKNHSVKTKEILDKILFEGELKRVPQIAGAHHEMIDGSGYPDGLKGDEILLETRIITVADIFEAITSKRPYRDPMPLNSAFDLLFEYANTKLDKTIVKALYSYYSKAYKYDYFSHENTKNIHLYKIA